MAQKIKKRSRAKRNEQAKGQKSIPLLDFLKDEYRTHMVAARILERALHESGQRIERSEKFAREIAAGLAEVRGDPEAEKKKQEELYAVRTGLANIQNGISDLATRLHERAGILWGFQRVLGAVEPNKYPHPQRLPGLPQVDDVPMMDNIDPPTIADVKRTREEMEKQTKKKVVAADEKRFAKVVEGALDSPESSETPQEENREIVEITSVIQQKLGDAGLSEERLALLHAADFDMEGGDAGLSLAELLKYAEEDREEAIDSFVATVVAKVEEMEQEQQEGKVVQFEQATEEEKPDGDEE